MSLLKKKTKLEALNKLNDIDPSVSHIIASNMNNTISASSVSAAYNSMINMVTPSPRMKSTQELMQERDEEVTELAMQFENLLSDHLPDATKEEVRSMSKDITGAIYDSVQRRWYLEKSAGYTVTL